MQPALLSHYGGQEYTAFGLRIRSDRPIPFEPSSDARGQHLILREAPQLRSTVDRPAARCLHDAEDLPGGPRLRVYRVADVFVIEHPDYVLRLHPGEYRIDYCLSFDNDEAFRFGLMVERIAIPLFALLTRQHTVGVHGSAVTLGDRAWLFIGPSGVGKSTTARTLLNHGAQLLTDDLTLIDVVQHAVMPGCPAVRLWEPEGAVEQAIQDTQLTERTAKRWFRLARRHVASSAASIGGLVVLDPLAPASGAQRFSFERLRGQQAFAAVMRQVFNFSDPDAGFALRQFRNVKALLAEHRVVRYSYHRSKSGKPTHVEPLIEALRDL